MARNAPTMSKKKIIKVDTPIFYMATNFVFENFILAKVFDNSFYPDDIYHFEPGEQKVSLGIIFPSGRIDRSPFPKKDK